MLDDQTIEQPHTPAGAPARDGRFLLAVLPQFVIPTRPLLPQYLTIAATMTVVDVLVMCAYTGLASRLLGWLRTPRQQIALNRTMSALFAPAAVVLSLVRRGAPA